MESQQPYRPPAARDTARSAAGGTSSITRSMIESLQKTRPWVLFVGVLGMIGAGFVFLAGVVMIAVGGMPMFSDEMGPFVGPALGAIYLTLAVLYFIPSLFLLRYGGAIGRIGPRGDVAAFEEALGRQLSFWRFVGILAALMIALYVVLIVIVAISTVIGMSGGDL